MPWLLTLHQGQISATPITSKQLTRQYYINDLPSLALSDLTMNSLKISTPRQSVAFAPRPAARTQRLQGSRLAVRAEAINPDIKKDEPKVVDTMKAGDIKGKGVFCRCWKSGTFPMCDGSHVKHNKANDDNVGPLIIDNSE